MREGKLKKLTTKFEETPEAEKLLGAIRAYLWGDGKSEKVLNQSRDFGVTRALLAYDSDPRTDKISVKKDLISHAKKLGYIVAPYDSFGNIQSPKSANMICSVFDEDLYQTGGIIGKDGKFLKGFAGPGKELSSEALRKSKTPFIQNRVSNFTDLGVNGYFVDSDACGDLYGDYDSRHIIDHERDRENRIARRSHISSTRKLVLDSECGSAWAVPSLLYAHGMGTITSDYWWGFYRDKKKFGGLKRGRLIFSKKWMQMRI